MYKRFIINIKKYEATQRSFVPNNKFSNLRETYFLFWYQNSFRNFPTT